MLFSKSLYFKQRIAGIKQKYFDNKFFKPKIISSIEIGKGKINAYYIAVVEK